MRLDHLGYQESRGLKQAAMGQRVVYHLKRFGLFEGESLYSIKRAAMLHDFFVLGRSQKAIGKAADINTPGIMSANLDPGRYLGEQGAASSHA